MLSFFPQNVLDDIWDLIESVSEGFPTYSLMKPVRIRLITLLSRLSQGSGFVSVHSSLQGAFLRKALGGGISVLWTHFFPCFYLFPSLCFECMLILIKKKGIIIVIFIVYCHLCFLC